MTDTVTTNLLDLDRAGLVDFFTTRGEKAFRATQVMKWVYGQGVTDFEQMTNISKGLRADLQAAATLAMPTVVSDNLSDDGSRKWLLQMADGNCIETVFIPEAERGTLCVSSQVGCTLTCSFCHTGTQRLVRNLEPLLQQHADLSNSLQQLLDDIFAGRKRHRTYRQMKMYNDPALNPILYKNKK